MVIRSAEAGPLVEIASVPAVIDGVDADVTYGFAGSGADVPIVGILDPGTHWAKVFFNGVGWVYWSAGT